MGRCPSTVEVQLLKEKFLKSAFSMSKIVLARYSSGKQQGHINVTVYTLHGML